MLNVASLLASGSDRPQYQISLNKWNGMLAAISAAFADAVISVAQYGILTTNTAAQNTTAWNTMITALAADAYEPFSTYKQLGAVRFGKGKYDFAEALNNKYGTIAIEGAGSGQQTILSFPANSSGLLFQYYTSDGSSGGPVAAHDQSSYSTLRNVEIWGANVNNVYVPNEGEYHGVVIRAPTYFQNVTVNGFQGDGWHVVVGAGSGTDVGNANLFQLINCSGRFCRHGIQLGGADANAYTILGGSFDNNRAFGHFEPDNASLGGLVLGAHYDSNGATLTAPYTVATYNGNWYGVIYGEETWCSTHPPSGDTTDNTGWYYIGAGSATADRPAWTSGESYRASGPVLSKSLNSGTMFVDCYDEGGYGLPNLDHSNWALGGGLGNKRNVGNSDSLKQRSGFQLAKLLTTLGGIVSNGNIVLTDALPIIVINNTDAYSTLAFQHNGANVASFFTYAGDQYVDVNGGANALIARFNGTEAARFNASGLSLASGKTINFAGLVNAANDAAAASGGVAVGGVYRNGSALMVRVS